MLSNYVRFVAATCISALINKEVLWRKTSIYKLGKAFLLFFFSPFFGVMGFFNWLKQPNLVWHGMKNIHAKISFEI